MKKLELIRNLDKGYGIKDLITNKVIIPCMYESRQLLPIDEISEILEGVYLLKGNKNNKEVYGIYNSLTNDFIDLNYDSIEMEDNMIKLDGASSLIYDPRVSQNMKIETVIIVNNKEIMPIYKEVIPNVFILYSYEKPSNIIGFYDKNKNIFIKRNFTDYEIIKNVLVLKEKSNFESPPFVNRDRVNHKLYIQKTYISLYDSLSGKYISGDNYYDKDVEEYVLNKYRYKLEQKNYCKGIEQHNDVFLINHRAIFDSSNGYLKENIFCIYDNNKIEIYDESEKIYLGYYDLDDKIEYNYLKINECDENLRNKLYVFNDDLTKYVYVDNGIYTVKVFSDFFVTVTEEFTIIFDKSYELLYEGKNNINDLLKIYEINPEMTKEFGVNLSNNAVYLVNGKLCTFSKQNEKNLKEHLPFLELPKNIISLVDYEYGIGIVSASSEIELDYELEQIDMVNDQISKQIEMEICKNDKLKCNYPNLAKKLKLKTINK